MRTEISHVPKIRTRNQRYVPKMKTICTKNSGKRELDWAKPSYTKGRVLLLFGSHWLNWQRNQPSARLHAAPVVACVQPRFHCLEIEQYGNRAGDSRKTCPDIAQAGKTLNERTQHKPMKTTQFYVYVVTHVIVVEQTAKVCSIAKRTGPPVVRASVRQWCQSLWDKFGIPSCVILVYGTATSLLCGFVKKKY